MFKKYLFIVFALVMIVGASILGFWQIERLHWKENLIKQAEKFESANPVTFTSKNFDPKAELFKPVLLYGTFKHKYELLLSAKYFDESRDKNQIGYHVITPFVLTDGSVVFVNRGWIPEKYKSRKSRPDSLTPSNTETAITGIVRETGGHAPWYMPQNMPQKNVWFWIELSAMKKKLQETSKLKNIKEILIQQTEPSNANGFKYPVAVKVSHDFYNQHMNYVITWFLVAFSFAVMLGIYIKKEL